MSKDWNSEMNCAECSQTMNRSAVAGRLSLLIHSDKLNHKAEYYEKLRISLWSVNAKKETVISKLSCGSRGFWEFDESSRY